MWAGICYGLTIAMAGLSIFAPCLPRRHRTDASGGTIATVNWPALIGLVMFFIIGIGVAVKFGEYYQTHWTGPQAGSIRYGAENELIRYHFWLALICYTVTGNIVARMILHRTAGANLCGLAGIGSGVMAATTFILTLPRGGDEGVFLWLFMTPFMFLGVLVLVVISFIAMLINYLRWRKFELCEKENKRKARRDVL